MADSIETLLELTPLRINVDRDKQVVHFCSPNDDDINMPNVVTVSFDSIPLLISTLQRAIQD